MKVLAAILTFIFTVAVVCWLMVKMAGVGMPAHPLDLEKPKIEFVMKVQSELEEKEEQIDFEEYVDYFDLETYQERKNNS